ncbi:YrrS family protein [Bacillus sp. OAE603]|uniref:YrrS family protein n=1 Tax=Gottfriedia sp. OAE603 TaxID=2663872 RepID=UPI00178BDAF1
MLNNGNSRATFRAKRKKNKLILTGSIAIGIILIVFVTYSIFSSNDNNASQESTQASTENQEKPTGENSTEDETETNEDTASEDQTQIDQSSSETVSGDFTSDSSQSNSTIAPETPEQTGMQHVTNYDSSSQDWQDMLQTISTSTGIDQNNMTVWFLGSDKSNPGGSVGTVSAKEKGSQKYRVFLEWNGTGYIATKIETAS